jgi:hypothetical protein
MRSFVANINVSSPSSTFRLRPRQGHHRDQADGSWVRTVALTGQEKKEGMQMTPSLDEIFKFPTAPNGNRSNRRRRKT